MKKISLTLNEIAALELLSQLEKLNGFIIVHVSDKKDRYDEFGLVYELMDKLKERRDIEIISQ